MIHSPQTQQRGIIADCTMYPDDVVVEACRQVIDSDAPQYERDRAEDVLHLIEGEAP